MSGNPGGRSPRIGPNGETAAQLARIHTTDAINCLVEVMKNKKAAAIARVSAANALLDRGWGKAKEEPVDGESDSSTLGDELLRLLASKLPD